MSRRWVTVEDVYKPGREPGGYLRWCDACPTPAAEHEAVCDRCGTAIERPRSNQRFCSVRCRRIAWRRQDRLRSLARKRALPPPTPEQIAAVVAEMQAALDAWEAVLR